MIGKRFICFKVFMASRTTKMSKASYMRTIKSAMKLLLSFLLRLRNMAYTTPHYGIIVSTSQSHCPLISHHIYFTYLNKPSRTHNNKSIDLFSIKQKCWWLCSWSTLVKLIPPAIFYSIKIMGNVYKRWSYYMKVIVLKGRRMVVMLIGWTGDWLNTLIIE